MLQEGTQGCIAWLAAAARAAAAGGRGEPLTRCCAAGNEFFGLAAMAAGPSETAAFRHFFCCGMPISHPQLLGLLRATGAARRLRSPIAFTCESRHC